MWEYRVALGVTLGAEVAKVVPVARAMENLIMNLPSDKPDASELLQGLVGKEMPTMTGKPNRVLRVDAQGVVVATGKSPTGQRVPVADIENAIDRLWRDGELEISVPSVGYRSAFIGAVLQTIPGTVALTRPRRIRLG